MEKVILDQMRTHMAGGQSANVAFIAVSTLGALISLGIAGLVGHLKYVVRKIDESHKTEVADRSEDVREIKVDISNLYDRLNSSCDLLNQMKGAHDRNHRD